MARMGRRQRTSGANNDMRRIDVVGYEIAVLASHDVASCGLGGALARLLISCIYSALSVHSGGNSRPNLHLGTWSNGMILRRVGKVRGWGCVDMVHAEPALLTAADDGQDCARMSFVRPSHANDIVDVCARVRQKNLVRHVPDADARRTLPHLNSPCHHIKTSTYNKNTQRSTIHHHNRGFFGKAEAADDGAAEVVDDDTEPDE